MDKTVFADAVLLNVNPSKVFGNSDKHNVLINSMNFL